jgi:PIN domain nuclease of toxin-antitoxin system
MRTLLDTQLYLWFLSDSPKLSKKARGFIGDVLNNYFFMGK